MSEATKEDRTGRRKIATARSETKGDVAKKTANEGRFAVHLVERWRDGVVERWSTSLSKKTVDSVDSWWTPPLLANGPPLSTTVHRGGQSTQQSTVNQPSTGGWWTLHSSAVTAVSRVDPPVSGLTRARDCGSPSRRRSRGRWTAHTRTRVHGHHRTCEPRLALTSLFRPSRPPTAHRDTQHTHRLRCHSGA